MIRNMYEDAIKRWNVVVGCEYECIYCKKSFKAQLKRQLHNCIKCYNYDVHFHPERLMQSLPLTKGDEFIWACASGDITFAEKEWMDKILERVKQLSNRTFFFQTKNPICFNRYKFPENCILGITLETNRGANYKLISKALQPSFRYKDFLKIDFPRKSITVEPILDFDVGVLAMWIYNIRPERVYVGYDTKRNNLSEPSMEKTDLLINELKRFTKVKTKFMKRIR